jgi:hypothetical protein
MKYERSPLIKGREYEKRNIFLYQRFCSTKDSVCDSMNLNEENRRDKAKCIMA